MLKMINECSGLIAVASIALWFVLPGNQFRRTSYSPIPPSTGNILHDGLRIIFSIAWLTYVATLFQGAWIAVSIFLCIGIVVLIVELRK